MALLSGAAGLAQESQSPQTAQYELESIVVNGGRVPMDMKSASRIVTVIDSVALRSAPVTTVNDALKYLVGVDVRQRGQMGVQTDIGIRGSTSDQVAILLNGINISDPHTGHNAVDLPVSIEDIARIEVLEGPAAKVYGSTTQVGAIKVVTKDVSEGKGLSAHLSGGSFGSAEGGLRLSGSKNRFEGSVSGTYSRSDGYLRNSEGGLNSDYEIAKGFLNAKYEDDLVSVALQGGVSVKDFGANTFYSTAYDDQFEHTFKTFAAIQGETKTRLSVRPSVYWNFSRDRFELFRERPDLYAFNHHRTNVFGADLNFRIDWILGKLSFGADVRREAIISTNLGEDLSSPKSVPGYDVFYTQGLSRVNVGIYVEDNFTVGRFSASVGACASKNNGNSENMRIYPGVDLSYRLSDAWKVYGSYNSSLRMPTFTELYYSVGGYSADKDLKAEKMDAFEGGVKYLNNGVRAVASVFYNMGTNTIDWIRSTTEEDAVWQSVNYTEIDTFGQELSLDFDLPAIVRRENFFLQRLWLSYCHLNMSKKIDEGLESRYALNYLRHKFVVRADFRILKNLSCMAALRYQDRVGDYKPYSVTDVKLEYAPKGCYAIFLEANNLFDHTYCDYGDIPQAGLNARLGLRLAISD